MPKEKIKVEKRKEFETFVKVTYRTLARFGLLSSEDEINLTTTNRGIKEYSKKLFFGATLKNYIIRLSTEKGKKLTILDSGCGSCQAIDELLSDRDLDPHIEHITGISKHYFENTKLVLEKHGKRFRYYYGSAIGVLASSSELRVSFDLILDVWGAYPYSQDKLELLKQYHAALKSQGSAFIYTAESLDKKREDLSIKTSPKKDKEKFINWAIQNHPSTFSTLLNEVKHRTVLCITKSTVRWPISSYKVVSSKLFKTISDPPMPKEKLIKGNAMMFGNVILEPSKTPCMELRPLSYKI